MCNNCIYKICDPVNVCDDQGTVKIPATASAAGEHVLHLKYLNVTLSFPKTFAIGNQLEFEALLNGNYCYEAYVLNPTGGKVSVTIDGILYENFKFCTKQTINNASINAE